MHILSPETDNCPSWISGRKRMTIENISWSISTKECCRPQQGLNPRPPGLQSDGASNWATEASLCFFPFILHFSNSTKNLSISLLIPAVWCSSVASLTVMRVFRDPDISYLPKDLDILTPLHMFPKTWTSLFGYLFLCLNPCHAEWIKMSRPLLMFSQSDNFIQVVDINSHI